MFTYPYCPECRSEAKRSDVPYSHASMLQLGEGSEATEPYNKYDKIRPHSIRSLQFDQKVRHLSFRPKKFDLFTATQTQLSYLRRLVGHDLQLEGDVLTEVFHKCFCQRELLCRQTMLVLFSLGRSLHRAWRRSTRSFFRNLSRV